MTSVESVVSIRIEGSDRKIFVLEAEAEDLLAGEGFVFVGSDEYEKRFDDGRVIVAWITFEQPPADALRHTLREVGCSLKEAA